MNEWQFSRFMTVTSEKLGFTASPAASEVKAAHATQSQEAREAAVHLTHFQLSTAALKKCVFF